MSRFEDISDTTRKQRQQGNNNTSLFTSSSINDGTRINGTTSDKITSSARIKLNHQRTFEQLTASTMSQAFYSYGKFCVCHPWEVIVAFFTLSICAISIGSRSRGVIDHHRTIPCNNIPCPSKVSVLLNVHCCLVVTISWSLRLWNRQQWLKLDFCKSKFGLLSGDN